MKKKILKGTMLFAMLILGGFQLKGMQVSLNLNDEIIGKYDMEVKGVPYGYEEGILSIENIGQRLESKVELAGAVFRATKTEITGKKVLIDVYIEGIAMKLDLQYHESKLIGTVSSSSMNFDIYATKMDSEEDALFGIYDMEVQDAPYGYREGTLSIQQNGTRIDGTVEVAGAVFRATKVEVSGTKVLMDIYIEGIPMKLDLEYNDSTLTGKVRSTDMNLDLYAMKIEESDTGIMGDYDLKVEEAPSGYEKGVLSIRNQNERLQSEIEIAGNVFRAMKTEIDGKKVTITIYIEGIPMKLDMNYEDSQLTGTVTSTEMTLKATATKI